MNYLRPDIKRGNITEDEDDLISDCTHFYTTDGHSLQEGFRVELITGSRTTGTHLSKNLKNQGTNPNLTKFRELIQRISLLFSFEPNLES